MDTLTSLTAAQAAAVRALVVATGRADGVNPLNEEAILLLTRGEARHWLLGEGPSVTGYAQWQPGNATGQILVHPEHRRRGHGSRLWRRIAATTGTPAVWAFGDLPAAQGFATAHHLGAVRGLHIMARDLDAAIAPTPPAGITLRGFTDADTDAFVTVNAAAFADHPEQGHFSAIDLAHRRAEAWWDPSGLILAEDADGVVGFHWTKRHDATTGEVYVLGVHPRAAGRGLGRVLLDAGLAHLAQGGATRVILYVDAGNARAVLLYQRRGFAIVHTDTLYRPVAPAPTGSPDVEGTGPR